MKNPKTTIGFYFSGLITAAMITSTYSHTVSLPENLVSKSESVQQVKTGVTFGEGPAVDPSGILYFTDRSPSRIWKVTTDGNATVFRNPANDANGLVFDPEGRLIVCEKKGLTRVEKDSSITTLLNADTLGSEGPNDLTLTSDEGIFFTSSIWNSTGKVFYRSPDSKVKTVLSFSAMNYPNGLEYIEEKNLLYLCITQSDSILKYRVNDDKSVTRLGLLCKIQSPDGLAIDNNGNLWVAASDGGPGVVVIDSTGNKLGNILIDNQVGVQNCAFGGPDNKTLYIAGRSTIFSIKTLVGGRSTTGEVTSIAKPHHKSFFMRKNLISGNSHVNVWTTNGRFIGSYQMPENYTGSGSANSLFPLIKKRLPFGIYYAEIFTNNQLQRKIYNISN